MISDPLGTQVTSEEIGRKVEGLTILYFCFYWRSPLYKPIRRLRMQEPCWCDHAGHPSWGEPEWKTVENGAGRTNGMHSAQNLNHCIKICIQWGRWEGIIKPGRQPACVSCKPEVFCSVILLRTLKLPGATPSIPKRRQSLFGILVKAHVCIWISQWLKTWTLFILTT